MMSIQISKIKLILRVSKNILFKYLIILIIRQVFNLILQGKALYQNIKEQTWKFKFKAESIKYDVNCKTKIAAPGSYAGFLFKLLIIQFWGTYSITVISW